MAEFVLPFDLKPFEELDQFALLACQDYNLGNTNDWFGCFRGGLYGLRSRIKAVRKHYYEVHVWIPVPRVLADAEYHLATIFFHMDSAIECLTFALNALGNSVAAEEFRNVADEKALRLVKPLDLLGDPIKGVTPLLGYGKYFPSLQAHWQNHRTLIQKIADQHDVSKHRETIFEGGLLRDDAPLGFYEALGLGEDNQQRWIYQPMAKINLHPNPKSPRVTRTPIPVEEQVYLETLAESFCRFINESARLSLEDAQSTIVLPHRSFK